MIRKILSKIHHFFSVKSRIREIEREFDLQIIIILESHIEKMKEKKIAKKPNWQKDGF